MSGEREGHPLARKERDGAQRADRSPAASEKLQKVLAARGLGSRREMERWIAAGRVAVNRSVAKLGDRVCPEDEVSVDGSVLGQQSALACRVLVVNKAGGVIVSRRDPQGRPSVFDQLPPPRQGRWVAVGRLDMQTTGLLLATNDGALAHALSHPSTGIDREYAVRVEAKLDQDAERQLAAGVSIDGRLAHFTDLRYYAGRGRSHWYHAVLMEGRNHEVRKLFAAVGVAVTRLKRVRYGPVILPPWLPRGTFEEMARAEVARLRRTVGLPGGTAMDADGAPKHGRSLLIPYPSVADASSSGA